MIPTATSNPKSVLRLHYLGHSSFIFAFDNGVTLLTDYGQSNAYGLDSPIHELGDFQPTLVVYSHHHPDHDRGRTFPQAKLIDGQDFSLNRIDIQAIPVSEKNEGDNYGYLIAYQGLSVFFAGDSQGDIIQIANTEIQQRLKSQLPVKIDLLLLPIGWISDIVVQAKSYVDVVQPRVAIPMHYWSPEDQARFLELFRPDSQRYAVFDDQLADWDVNIPASAAIQVIGLTAAPYCH